MKQESRLGRFSEKKNEIILFNKNTLKVLNISKFSSLLHKHKNLFENLSKHNFLDIIFLNLVQVILKPIITETVLTAPKPYFKSRIKVKKKKNFLEINRKIKVCSIRLRSALEQTSERKIKSFGQTAVKWLHAPGRQYFRYYYLAPPKLNGAAASLKNTPFTD